MSIQKKYIAGVDLAVNEDLPTIVVMEYNPKEDAWLLIDAVKLPPGRRARRSNFKRAIDWVFHFTETVHER